MRLSLSAGIFLIFDLDENDYLGVTMDWTKSICHDCLKIEGCPDAGGEVEACPNFKLNGEYVSLCRALSDWFKSLWRKR